MKRAANPLKIDLAKLPPSMRAKDYTPPDNPLHIAEAPLRTLLAQRVPDSSHVPTDDTRKGVMHAAAFDVEPRIIAMIAGISEETLKEFYAEELNIGKPLLMNDIETGVYNMAIDKWHKDAFKASTWLLERIGGERYLPRTRAEVTGRNGGPIQLDAQVAMVDSILAAIEKRAPILLEAQAVVDKPTPPTAVAIHEAQFEDVEDLLS